MDEKIIDSMKFAVNEKAERSLKLMNQYRNDNDKFEFYHGQYLAFSEIYTMLSNVS
jgi:hypothetical protein